MNNPNTEYENQDKKDGDTIKQAAPNVTIHIHAVENEEEDVRGTVLREEKNDTGERNEPVDSRGVGKVNESVVLNVQVVAFQGQGQAQGQGGLWPGQGAGQPPQQQGMITGWSSMPSGHPMEKETRGPFIRKVLFMLFVCLCITCAFAVFTFVVDGVRTFFASIFGLILAILAILLYFAMMYTMICSECSRHPPCNYICLFLTVVAECLFFGFITARYSLKIVLLALLVTCIIVFVCVCLAFTPLDFTKCYMFAIVILVALAVFHLVFIMVQVVMKERFPLIHLVISLLFVLFHSIVFIMEIQMIVGGKTIELGVDDWAVGVFMLYTSIMSILFDVLRIIGIMDIIL